MESKTNIHNKMGNNKLNTLVSQYNNKDILPQLNNHRLLAYQLVLDPPYHRHNTGSLPDNDTPTMLLLAPSLLRMVTSPTITLPTTLLKAHINNNQIKLASTILHNQGLLQSLVRPHAQTHGCKHPQAHTQWVKATFPHQSTPTASQLMSRANRQKRRTPSMIPQHQRL